MKEIKTDLFPSNLYAAKRKAEQEKAGKRGNTLRQAGMPAQQEQSKSNEKSQTDG